MPVFMRRHYEVLATVIRTSYDHAANRQQVDGIQLLQRVLTATLRADNPRFCEQKFKDIIQAEDEPHGSRCASRFHSAAECTCGKADRLAILAEAGAEQVNK